MASGLDYVVCKLDIYFSVALDCVVCKLDIYFSVAWAGGCSQASIFKCSWETLFSLNSSLNGGLDTTCNLPLGEMGNSTVQTEPGLYGQFTRIENPMILVTSTLFIEKYKPTSLEEFKAWQNRGVNHKKHAENRYYIGTIHRLLESEGKGFG